MLKYPGATWRPSIINHPLRLATWGVCIHWTVGREAGDITVLDGPTVDCQIYVAKDGDIYQFLDMNSASWTALYTANHNAVHIETEGRGEAWTSAQLASIAKVCRWLSDTYMIPIVHVNPAKVYPNGTMPPPSDWHGFFGHADLEGIQGNNHWDSVPKDTGWDTFLAAVKAVPSVHETESTYSKIRKRNRVTVVVTKEDGTKKIYQGWKDAKGVLAWLANPANKMNPKTHVKIAWQGMWFDRGQEATRDVARSIYSRYQ